MSGRSVIGAVLMSLAFAASARSVELNVSDDALYARYAEPLRSTIGNPLEWDASVMHNGDKGDAATFGFHVLGDAGSRSVRLTAGVGGQAFWASPDGSNDDALGLALGGWIRAVPPQYDRLAFELRAHYAPNVLTFQDGDHYWEAIAKVAYQVLPNAEAYLGYRRIRLGLEDKHDRTIDSGFNVGLELRF